jgi:hypothetical protein
MEEGQMTSYASISVDRRADYYARCAGIIAADPLDFYTRAERGRRFQASRLKPQVEAAHLNVPSALKAVPSRLSETSAADSGNVRMLAGSALAA